MKRRILEDNPEARRRLTEEAIIWLTTVRGNGQPQTSPVWFLVVGDEFVVYSLPDTARISNIQANPRVALNLDGNGQGGAIVTIEGQARIDLDYPAADQVSEYVAKYESFMARNGWTPDVFAARYSTPIRINPIRGRAW
jgi:PPOX class probable F420-dependent enzyme